MTQLNKLFNSNILINSNAIGASACYYEQGSFDHEPSKSPGFHIDIIKNKR